MNIATISGASRCLGAPPDWDPNGPPCGGLPVRDDEVDGIPCIVSAWTPSPEEVFRLIRGAQIHVWIAGRTTRPISLQVGLLEQDPSQ